MILKKAFSITSLCLELSFTIFSCRYRIYFWVDYKNYENGICLKGKMNDTICNSKINRNRKSNNQKYVQIWIYKQFSQREDIQFF